jgi:hypothetical protein
MMVLQYHQWQDFQLSHSFGHYLSLFYPYLLHFRSFEVGELPEVLVLGKIQCFVLVFKMNLHEIFPDGRVSFGAKCTALEEAVDSATMPYK